MIEHRYSPRRPLPAYGQVTLFTHGGECAACRIKDVSAEGVGLICDRADVVEGAVVELDVPASADGHGHCRLRSYVVHAEAHAEEKELGLMWLEEPPAYLQVAEAGH